MPSVPVYDNHGKKVEEIDVAEAVFSKRVNDHIIHQAVVMYQASLRQGNASTKERGSVEGSGKKLFRQKGTGNARAGDLRSPIRKGGGVVFGPHPRDFGYSVPKKVRIAALRETLNAKFITNDLYCVDHLAATTAKTKDFAKTLKGFNLQGKVLALLDKSDSDISKVSRNIPFFNLMRADDVTAYDILRNKKLLITKAALKVLLKRIK
ncbi:MAG: 50S ribosomal protein L4 [Candidatus Omnitrophota bacterium]